MATNWGQIVSNAGSGAATGGSVGGPWGAAIGGGLGVVNALFGEDPEAARKKAQKEYNKKMAEAGTAYSTAQGEVLGGYKDLYTPEGVKSAKEGYTGALTSSDPTKYAINAGDYQSTYKDPLGSWKDYLDPSIEFQQESARKNVEESAAGEGGLYSGSAANEIATNVASIAEKGYSDAYEKARQAGLDVNDITGENFERSLQSGDFNQRLDQTGIKNKGTAYDVERELMDTVSGGQSDLNKTQYDASTGMASTNLSGKLGNTGGPSTWDQLLGGVNSANDAGLFNKGFWNFGGK
jgi:major membrane immunogen (membrane-anchored lipoprotein)